MIYQNTFLICDLLKPYKIFFFQPYLFNLMHKLFDHIDFEENPDDDPLTILVRMKLYTFGCTFGHSKCLAKITAKLLAYVEDPIANK